MHAFKNPSHQLRQKDSAVTHHIMHHTSLYRRLILQGRKQGARIANTGKVLHTWLRDIPKEGTNLLKCVYGQQYNGKLAHRYDHAPTDECPLCHLPDSCQHLAGKCEAQKTLHINRHNAACQLVYAAIRNSAKDRGALYRAKDLILVTTNADTQPQTSIEDIQGLGFRV